MIFVIIAIIVLVVWIIAVYNGLVKSRMQTKESWSQIDVQLKRRNDLIPNLIETVKGYAAYEEKTFAKITELRSQVAQAETPAEAMHAPNALTKQLSTTANYNVKLETFPSNIIAGMFGFKPSQFLETPEDEKETPKVSFDF